MWSKTLIVLPESYDSSMEQSNVSMVVDSGRWTVHFGSHVANREPTGVGRWRFGP